MTEDTIQIGDVVQLKSGGPTMTVSYESDDRDSVGCTWFTTDNMERHYADFNPATLKRWESPMKGMSVGH